MALSFLLAMFVRIGCMVGSDANNLVGCMARSELSLFGSDARLDRMHGWVRTLFVRIGCMDRQLGPYDLVRAVQTIVMESKVEFDLTEIELQLGGFEACFETKEKIDKVVTDIVFLF